MIYRPLNIAHSLLADNPKIKFTIIPEPPRKVRMPARPLPKTLKNAFSPASLSSLVLICSGILYEITRSS